MMKYSSGLWTKILFSVTLGISVISVIYLWLNNMPIRHGVYSLETDSLGVLVKNRPTNLSSNLRRRNATIRTHAKLEYTPTAAESMWMSNESNRDVSSIFRNPWKQNVSNLEKMRSDLKEIVHTELFLNRRNVKKSQKFKYMIPGGSLTTNLRFYKLMQEYSPEQTVYKRCSIVGNGGILNGSKCGREIDKADFVIRCNVPPIIGQFIEDAGVKSNITTLNPSIVIKRFGSLRTGSQQSKFINKMKEYNNYIWFPSFSSGLGIYNLAIKVNNLLNGKLKSIKFVHGNPNHFHEIRSYWLNKGLKNMLSTGIYITTSSLLFCDEIHLYGFWPFSTDIHNRPAAYHYYEDMKRTTYHAFNQEFDELLNLHINGVLQLHVKDC